MNLDAIKKELAELLELRESELQVDVLLHPLSNWDSLTKVTLLGVLLLYRSPCPLALNACV